MALYSFTVKAISRIRNESAVKVAAYQSRSIICDKRMDTTYDFSKKTDLIYSHIFLPAYAPPAFFERDTIWNAAEAAERRYDARTGRALCCALPNELPLENHVSMVKSFVEAAFIVRGMCADVALHSGIKTDGTQNNPHVHILLTDRPVCNDGFCAKKNREWNKRENVIHWRELWERIINREYERNGLDIRVSCESLRTQGIEREATKHLGRSVIEMEKRGILTERGNENREIISRNKEKEHSRDMEHSR